MWWSINKGNTEKSLIEGNMLGFFDFSCGKIEFKNVFEGLRETQEDTSTCILLTFKTCQNTTLQLLVCQKSNAQPCYLGGNQPTSNQMSVCANAWGSGVGCYNVILGRPVCTAGGWWGHNHIQRHSSPAGKVI